MLLSKFLRNISLLAFTGLAIGWSHQAHAFGTIGLNFGTANTYGNEYSTRNWELNLYLSDNSTRNVVIGYLGGTSGAESVSITKDQGLDGLPLSGNNFIADKRISTSSFNFGGKYGYIVPVTGTPIFILPYVKLGLEKLTSTLTYRTYPTNSYISSFNYRELELNDSFNLQYGVGILGSLANFTLGVEYSITDLDGSQELRDAQNAVRTVYRTPVAAQPRHAQTTFSIGYSF